MMKYVIFDTHDKTDCAMVCFHSSEDKQAHMMHKLDVDSQVKEWQLTNSGQPPIFGSRIKIRRFTTENIRFKNLKLT